MRNFTLAIIALLLVRCNKPDAPDCFQSKGDTVTEQIELTAPFQSIIVYDNIQLVLTNDSTSEEFCEITGPENLIPDVRFSINDGELTIENQNTCNWVRGYNEFVVSLNKSNINHIFNLGTKGVDVNYTSPSLVIEQQNSLADNTIIFTGDSLTVNLHTGSGSALVTGSAEYGQLYCNGFSSLSTDGFEVQRVLANNSGAGSMFVTPSVSLFAFIGGSGNIIYTGDSVELSSELIGSGEVILYDN